MSDCAIEGVPNSWMRAHAGSTNIASEATAALEQLRCSGSPVDKLAQRQAAKGASAGAAADSREAAKHEALDVQVPFCLPVGQAGMVSGNHLCRTLELLRLVRDLCEYIGGSFQRNRLLPESRDSFLWQHSTGRDAAESYLDR